MHNDELDILNRRMFHEVPQYSGAYNIPLYRAVRSANAFEAEYWLMRLGLIPDSED